MKMFFCISVFLISINSIELNTQIQYRTDKTYSKNVPIAPVLLMSGNYFAQTEVDNKKCDTVKICEQVWMGCNLNVDQYRNGDPIPEVTDPKEWENLTTGAWCYFNNDPENGKKYGKLYNWYAVNDPRGLAPEGWHVPSDEEWKELEICLGMCRSEADQIGYRGEIGPKLAGRSDLWNSFILEEHQSFNSSGFSALPGGCREFDGLFNELGYLGIWWSATEYLSYVWIRDVGCFSYHVKRNDFGVRESGFSVRCVKD